jgi:predicted nucleic acid-binding protein
VEVVRVCRRSNAATLPAVHRFLNSLNLIPLTPDLLDRAALLGPPLLRSLDAIHLASALTLGAELTAFVAYDRRLQAAALEERVPVAAPS